MPAVSLETVSGLPESEAGMSVVGASVCVAARRAVGHRPIK